MRRRIRNVGDRDRDFLPEWMRTIQDFANYELGYTKALTLCYAKPGRGASVLSRIKFNTAFASRGEFATNTLYQVDDSVNYRGDFYICIKNNQGILPTDSDFWLKKFNFRDIDFEADRYTIDSINNEIVDKYLVFPQRDILNKLANPSQIIETESQDTVSVLGTFDDDTASFDNESITFDQDL
jgi:hypothetical protein